MNRFYLPKLLLLVVCLLTTVASYAQSTGREHPLARDERVARIYSYPVPEDRKREILKADGFREVETITYTHEATGAVEEASLLWDSKRKEYVVAFRGTELSWNLGEWQENLSDTGLGDIDTEDEEGLHSKGQSSVGEFAFLQMRKRLKGWVDKYGKKGKFRAVGHSKGGGMALHFTAEFPSAVSQVVALNPPGQSQQLCDLYEKKLEYLHPDDHPRVTLAFATKDPIGNVGENYIGGPHRRVILAHGTDIAKLSMATLWETIEQFKTYFGHSAFFFASPTDRLPDGKLAIAPDSGRVLREIAIEDWLSLRGTYRRSSNLVGAGVLDILEQSWVEAAKFVMEDPLKVDDPIWFEFSHLSLEAPSLVNPGEEFTVRPKIRGGVAPLTYVWMVDGTNTESSSSELTTTLHTEPGHHTIGLMVFDNLAHTATATCQVELLGNSLTVSLEDARTGKPVEGKVTAQVGRNRVIVPVSGTGTFAIHLGAQVIATATAAGYKPVSEKAWVQGGEAHLKLLLGNDLPITLTPSEDPILMGERVKVVAAVQGGQPPYQTSWKLDGRTLPKAKGRLDIKGKLKEVGTHQFEIEVIDAQDQFGKAVLEVEAEPAGRLLMEVQDKLSRQPVVAEVQLDDRVILTTSSEGQLEVILPAAQPSTLMIRSNGYVTKRARGQVAAGQTKRYLCQLTPLEARTSPPPAARRPARTTGRKGQGWSFFASFPGQGSLAVKVEVRDGQISGELLKTEGARDPEASGGKQKTYDIEVTGVILADRSVRGNFRYRTLQETYDASTYMKELIDRTITGTFQGKVKSEGSLMAGRGKATSVYSYQSWKLERSGGRFSVGAPLHSDSKNENLEFEWKMDKKTPTLSDG